jgi:hypothetical protein
VHVYYRGFSLLVTDTHPSLPHFLPLALPPGTPPPRRAQNHRRRSQARAETPLQVHRPRPQRSQSRDHHPPRPPTAAARGNTHPPPGQRKIHLGSPSRAETRASLLAKRSFVGAACPSAVAEGDAAEGEAVVGRFGVGPSALAYEDGV